MTMGFKQHRDMKARIRLSAATQVAVTVFTLCCLGSGCRPEADRDRPEPQPKDTRQAVQLVFPDALRVDDQTVNDFVQRAIEDCARGEYEAFRLLWSVREEPLPREEYEEGWQAIQSIRILALEKIFLAPGAGGDAERAVLAYALAMHVALDPTHRAAKREPQRDVVLLLIREHDEWRISRAPKGVRTWIETLLVRPDTATSGDTEPPIEDSGSD